MSSQLGTNLAGDELSISPPEARTDGNYTVGYGKPPSYTRFSKGRSGNPRGRPKKVRDLHTEVTEALNHSVSIRLGEHWRQVSTLAAMLLRQVDKALKGDTRSAKWIVDVYATLSAQAGKTTIAAAASQGAVTIGSSDDTDRAIVDAFRQRVLEEAQQKLNLQTSADPDVGTTNLPPGDEEEVCHE
jgi:hypothetical protein